MSKSEVQKPVSHWVVTGVGPDKPGIVAGLTDVIWRHGANLEDSTMTRLAGEFAMILIVSLPTDADEVIAGEVLRRDFGEVEQSLGITINVQVHQPHQAQATTSNSTPYVIVVSGADQAGIVARFSKLLAEAGLSITDLQARQLPGGHGAGDIYLLMIEIELPDAHDWDEAQLEKRLRRLGEEMNVDVRLNKAETAQLG